MTAIAALLSMKDRHTNSRYGSIPADRLIFANVS
jgi:hypothetical protein